MGADEASNRKARTEWPVALAPLVGANLEIMEADALRTRAKRPFVFTNLKSGQGVDQIARLSSAD